MTTKTTQPFTGSDACLSMHTALRKCCEGPITSALYNLIHLRDIKPEKFDAWVIYGNMVADRMSGLKGSPKLLKAAMEDLDDAYYAILKEDRASEPTHAKNFLYAVLGIMRCFEDEDWAGMAAYLE